MSWDTGEDLCISILPCVDCVCYLRLGRGDRGATPSAFSKKSFHTWSRTICRGSLVTSPVSRTGSETETRALQDRTDSKTDRSCSLTEKNLTWRVLPLPPRCKVRMPSDTLCPWRMLGNAPCLVWMTELHVFWAVEQKTALQPWRQRAGFESWSTSS